MYEKKKPSEIDERYREILTQYSSEVRDVFREVYREQWQRETTDFKREAKDFYDAQGI